VKKINPNGSKTIYLGGIYEVDKTSGGSVTRTVTYYPVAGAMRIGGVLYYILKDHLGSASVVTDSTGAIVSGSEQRYYPYGESRLAGTMLTDKLFTGQRDVGLGIYHYGARFYSPKLGRFLSPDTIVPGAANPQAFNRYSYVLGNPLKYIDPTGHYCVGDDEDCADEGGYGPASTGSNNTPAPQPEDDFDPHDDDDADPNPLGLPGSPECYPGELMCSMAEELDCDSYSAYSPCSAGWHYYSNANNPSLVCPAIYHCRADEMMDYLLRFAYPNQDPAIPVSPGGTYPVGFNGVSLRQLGMISVDISDDGLTSINTTLPGHIFYNGTITRTVSQGADGAWYVTTTGVGNNVVLGMNIANQVMGPDIFDTLDKQMFDYIAAQH
jgi:RHS repeat-associated protein